MKAIVLAMCAGLCWGVGEVFTKSVLHTGKVGPVTALAVRSMVALPVILLTWFIALRLGDRAGMKPEPADWLSAGTPTLAKLFIGSGLIAGAAAMLFFYISLSFGEVSRVKPIAFSLAPVVAVLLGWLVLGEAMTARKAVGVLLVISGVVVLTGR